MDLQNAVKNIMAFSVSESSSSEDFERFRKFETSKNRRRQWSDTMSEIDQSEHNDVDRKHKQIESDSRSIYVGNVDYCATADDLEDYFKDCGGILRTTIMANKYTGRPKGYAYIEFLSVNSVEVALVLDGTLFKGRQIKVNRKRTNMPGMSSISRFPKCTRRYVPHKEFVY